MNLSMLKFKNLSIKYKVTVFFMPPFIVFVLIILGYFFYFNYTTTMTVNKENTQVKLNYFNYLVKDAQNKAFQIAHLVSKYQFVEKALLDKDENQGSDYLKSLMIPIIKGITSDLDKFQIHFHKPNSISFLRTWTKKHGDNLASFRSTINELNQTKQPVLGIELGVGGFAIRGIVPIFSEKNDFIGSVEFFYAPEELLKMFNENDVNFGYFSGVNKKIADNLFEKSAIQKSFSESNDDYYFSKSSNKKFEPKNIITPEIQKEILNLTDIKIFANTKEVIGINPIKDFKNNNVGFIAIITGTENLIVNLIYQGLYLLGVISISSIFLMIAYFYAMNNFVIKPIDRANEIAKKISHGDFDIDL